MGSTPTKATKVYMTVSDLEFIFGKQINEGTKNLHFMIVDKDRKTVMRHPLEDLEALLPMLDNFIYAGSEVMPRFLTNEAHMALSD